MYDPERHVLKALVMEDAEAPEGADLAMTMPVSPQVTNPRGALQGGLVATLIDVVAGRVAIRLAGPGKTTPTSDLHVRYLAPITVGPALAVARVLRRGRTSIVLQVDVYDSGRDVHATTATVAFTVLEARPGQDVPKRVFE